MVEGNGTILVPRGVPDIFFIGDRFRTWSRQRKRTRISQFTFRSRIEDVEVFRPTDAMAFRDGYFKVLPHYVPTDEEWQFVPETIVKGEWRKNGSDEYLYAIENLVLSPEEIEWLSFVDEGEYELWGIRKHLEVRTTQQAFVGLIKKHLIQINKDGVMLNEAEAIQAIESPLTGPEPALELVITPSGRLIYFQDPQIKRYFEEKSKKGA